MMKTLLIPCLLITTSLCAQNTFQRVADDVQSDFSVSVKSANGELYMAGIHGSNYRHSVLVEKYAMDGTFIWSNMLGTSDTLISLIPKDIIALSSGGLAITGDKNHIQTTDDDSAFVAVLDAAGDLVWMRTFGSFAGANFTRGRSLAQAANGDLFAAGDLDIGMGYATYLTRFSLGGAELWSKEINSTVSGSFAQPGALHVPASGGVLVSGNNSTSTEGPWLMLLDDNGNSQWVKKYGPVGAGIPVPRRLFSTANGYDMVLLRGLSVAYGEILHLNATGDLMSSTVHEIDNGTFSYVRDAYSAHGGGYVLVGEDAPGFDLGAMAIKVDAAGNPDWAMSYGAATPESGSTVVATDDGGYLIGGYGRSSGLVENGTATNQAYVLKTNGLGQTGLCEVPRGSLTTQGTLVSSTYSQNVAPLAGGAGWGSFLAVNSPGIVELEACIAAGVETANPIEFLVFPMPAGEQLVIDTYSSESWQHDLFDAAGRSVLMTVGHGEKHVIDVSSIVAGHYTLVSTAEGQRVTTPVMILR